jgi:hypothetical protein
MLSMNILDAAELLSELPTDELESLIPDDAFARCAAHDCNRRGLLVTFLASAVELSGQLNDCRDLNDLRVAIGHFNGLWSAEVIDADAWSAAANELFGRMEEDALRLAMEIGRNAPFTQAELN